MERERGCKPPLLVFPNAGPGRETSVKQEIGRSARQSVIAWLWFRMFMSSVFFPSKQGRKSTSKTGPLDTSWLRTMDGDGTWKVSRSPKFKSPWRRHLQGELTQRQPATVVVDDGTASKGTFPNSNEDQSISLGRTEFQAMKQGKAGVLGCFLLLR